MSTLLLGLLFLPLLLLMAKGDWRSGVLYTVVIGFLQDPLRKFTPNQPSLYVGLALLSLLASAFVLFQRQGRVNLQQLFQGNRLLLNLIQALIALVVLQALRGVLQLRTPTLIALGLGFYGAPMIATWTGYQFGLQPNRIRRFLGLYLVMVLLFTATLLTAYSGVQSGLLAEVGSGVQIHIAELGAYVQGFCGFWRSSEIAAWHLGAGCCFLLILAVASQNPTWISLASTLMAGLLLISTLTGRRKVLVFVCTFLALYGLLVVWRGEQRSRANLLVGAAGAGVLGMLLSFGEDPTSSGSLGVYARRTGSVWEQVSDRFQALGFNAIGGAVSDVGPFGAGIGAAVQGAGSLGLGSPSGTWAAEGGLGKVAAELGLPGVVLFGLIAWQLLRHVLSILDQLALAPISYRLVILGLIAFLASNIPNFLVASQVYGDPFVLIVIGLSAGFVLAAPTVIQGLQRQPSAMDQRPATMARS